MAQRSSAGCEAEALGFGSSLIPHGSWACNEVPALFGPQSPLKLHTDWTQVQTLGQTHQQLWISRLQSTLLRVLRREFPSVFRFCLL